MSPSDSKSSPTESSETRSPFWLPKEELEGVHREVAHLQNMGVLEDPSSSNPPLRSASNAPSTEAEAS